MAISLNQNFGKKLVEAQNLDRLIVHMTDEQLARLEEASKVELGYLHGYYVQPMASAVIYGGTFDQLDSHRPFDMPETLLALAARTEMERVS